MQRFEARLHEAGGEPEQDAGHRAVEGRPARWLRVAGEREQGDADSQSDGQDDRPLAVGSIVTPARRVAVDDEQRKPEHDHRRPDHLAATDDLVGEKVAER